MTAQFYFKGLRSVIPLIRPICWFAVFFYKNIAEQILNVVNDLDLLKCRINSEKNTFVETKAQSFQ